MVDQQKLDFNRPVLSVRRIGPTAAEGENKGRTDIAHNDFAAIPFYKADLKSGPVRNPGTVPFMWEQTPGRPKHERKSLHQNSELPPIAPRLPPGRRRDVKEKLQPVRSPDCVTIDGSRPRNLNSTHNIGNPLDAKTDKLGSSQEECKELESNSSEDDAYADARDTLSRSESFFDNCSLTGLSGMDGSDVTLTGTVSSDPRTVDFMMGRFLPAAKAMASETPPHSSKKLYAVRERPKQATVTVKAVKRVSTPDYKPNLLRHYIQHDIEEDSEENMDDEYDQSHISSKGCGLLPRFCLLNPVPGLRILPQTGAKSVRRVPANSLRTSSGTKCVTKISSTEHHRATEIPEDRSSPSVESVSQQNESFLCNSNDEKQFAGISSESKQAKNFALGPKAFKTFQDFLIDQTPNHESPPESPMVEKTLYIDSGNGAETPSSVAIIEDGKRITETVDDLVDVPSGDSSLQEIKHLSIEDKNKALKSEIMGRFNTVETLALIPHQYSRLIEQNSPVEDEFSDKGSATSVDLKALHDRDHIKQELHSVRSNKIPTGSVYSQFPQLPPLPNSPSDSWLCKALPSVSSRNQSSRPYHGSPMNVYSKQQVPKHKSVDPKWETMVKTSKPQRGHHRYSEDMLAPIPEA